MSADLHLPASVQPDPAQLVAQLRDWAAELGFQQLGISDTNVRSDALHLDRWLAEGMHGEMDYMARHAELRANPERLVEGKGWLPSVLRTVSDAAEPEGQGADEPHDDDAYAFAAE